MAKQKIVWTALPWGRIEDGPLAGRLRISIVVSPRLTPLTAAEQMLGASGFADFHNWPKTLDKIRLRLRVGAAAVPLEILGRTDPDLWTALLGPTTPVAGFVFNDMSQVNLHSYPVRNVLGFLRRHYGNLATLAAGTHPTLLPWAQAHGGLRDMLTELGTRTQKIDFGHTSVERLLPGFDRFFDDGRLDKLLREQVFGPDGKRRLPVVGPAGQPGRRSATVRALPSDWHPAVAGAEDAAVMAQFGSADEYAFYQANRFYRRSVPGAAERRLRRPDGKDILPPPQAPKFDFHERIASFADYPALLRALGLIIDCALPAANPVLAALAGNASAEGTCSVEADWADSHDKGADAYPSVAWRVDKTRFVTRARSADHEDGMLRLAGASDPTLGPGRDRRGAFDVFQVDPDGGGLKTVNYLLTAQNLIGRSLKPGTHGEVAYTTGNRQPVAALRSGGIGVSRHARATEVALTAAATALKNTAIETSAEASRKVVLFIEDVLRGYRVDIHHRDRWRSLCEREGDYRLLDTGAALAFAADEGYVKGASTTGDGSDDHYLHEALFRWTGWSLAAPRPGRAIRATAAADSGLQGEAVTDIDDAASAGNGLAVRFRARRGSLPRLRFGEDYRVRARIVDLAGNSLALGEPTLLPLAQATEAVTYLRYEPVDPPAMVHRHRVSEGESLERLVLRSNFGVAPTDYLQTPDFAAAIALPASADFDYVADGERHLVPPKSAQLQCEQHGSFDAAIGGGAPDDIRNAYAIAAREAGTLYDPGPGTQIELVTPASVADVALTPAVPPAPPSASEPTGERLVGGQYILHREPRVATPYLPDPAAGGFALRGETREDFERIGITAPMVLGPTAIVVHAPNQELVLLVRNGGAWPDTEGLRLVVKERAHTLDDTPCEETFPDDGRPHWDEPARVLTLYLRKGHIARLRYASFVDARYLGHFGLPRWGNSTAEQQFIAGMALLGAHWMLTPYRALVLVHATQQPVCTPRLQKVTATREIGSTHADLDAAVQLHGASTGKLEILAHWQEWIDDLQQPRPQRLDMEARLAEITLPENAANHFGLAAAADAVQPPAGNAAVNPPVRAKGNRHDFGDTRFRLVRYQIEASTRFREYLPQALYAQPPLVTRVGPEALESQALVGGADDPGAPLLFDVAGASANGTRIRSTASPEVPRLVYCVPTFRWQQELGAARATQTSTRTGNGLRVYLERPWYSSGDGELLGVVLLADGGRFTDIPEALLPYVSQWGMDPLFDSALPKSVARASDFGARILAETLPLLESATPVHVVGHRVQWDDERKLWYSDIDLDTGSSYLPFVRLALVRYQPQSLAGAKISRVALAEFAQLLPRRRAVVQRTGPALQVSVHGTLPDRGPIDYRNDSAHLNISFIPPPGTILEWGRNKIELILQTRDPDLDSDLAWSDVATLATGLAVPPGGQIETAGGAGAGGGLFDQLAVSAPTTIRKRGATGIPLAFQAQLLNPLEPAAPLVPRVPFEPGISIGPLFDPVVWQASATLPELGGAPARLALREFERYYTDRTVPERRGGKTYRRRVVEERLVYCEFFPLN